MKNKVFAVYDTKAQYYKNPFMMRTKGEALRMFIDASNDTKTEIGKHPEDFCLFLLAEFDSERGVYENMKAPESMGMAIEFVKPDNQIKMPFVEEVKDEKRNATQI